MGSLVLAFAMGKLLLIVALSLLAVQVDLAAVGSKINLPKKVMGMYILLADNTEDGFHDDADWEPLLYPYQQEGSNVLFFTFIDPSTMAVPNAFKKLVPPVEVVERELFLLKPSFCSPSGGMPTACTPILGNG